MSNRTSSQHCLSMNVSTVSAPRLYVDGPLHEGVPVHATEGQSHYLLHVMRRGAGDSVVLFNGRDGEWSASLVARSKKHVAFQVNAQIRPQASEPDVWLIFAPLKSGPMEFVVEKATELGVSALMPVFTRRTVVHRVNVQRLTSIAVEAAEQCERLTVPSIAAPRPLGEVLAPWAQGQESRRLFFLDEGAARTKDTASLADAMAGARGPAAILVGPEGGFDGEEQAMLRQLKTVTPVILGPRILRAETAALAALSCWQAMAGDWQSR